MKLSKIFLSLLALIFITTLIVLLYRNLSQIDWELVADSFGFLKIQTVLLAIVAVLCNICILISFDVLSSQILQLGLNFTQVSKSAFLSYVLNMNFGAILGGVGVRFRLYKKLNVQPLKIPLIVIFSSLSNWIGYLLILGLILLFNPPSFAVKYLSTLTSTIGFFSLVISFLYLIACFKGLSFSIKKTLIQFPKFKWSLLQLLLGSFQWMTQSLVIFIFLNSFNVPISYYDVLATLLIAAIIGLLTHIPSGIGVLEGVFFTLTPSTYHPQVLAGLLCYRVVYNLVPLVFAFPSYLMTEAKGIHRSIKQY
jgi:uncharacterized membrane protein YbhN (UPF0104 family)